MADSIQLKILLVEDNDGDADLVHEYAQEVGCGRFEITRARTIAEADELRGVGGFDAVLLDLNLPDSKGLATLDYFCASYPDALRPPIIVLTGFDDEETAARAMQSCADDYLVKSEISGRNLLRAIRFAVQRHGKKRLDHLLAQQPMAEALVWPDEAAPGDGDQAIDTVKQGLEVVSRVNRTTFGQPAAEHEEQRSATAPGDLRVILQHMATGQKAGEVVMHGLEQVLTALARRLAAVEDAAGRLGHRLDYHDKVRTEDRLLLTEIRGDMRVLTAQLRPIVDLIRGDGKGHLASRIARMESAMDHHDVGHRPPWSATHRVFFAIGLGILGWSVAVAGIWLWLWYVSE